MARSGGWSLAIDFGTSYTAAAMARDGKVEVLEIDGSPRMPSLVLVGEEGELIVGRAAEQQAPLFPARVERAPKRYLGVPRPLLIDGSPVRAVEVVGRILEVVLTEARRRRGGSEPDEVILTHPARWGEARLEALIEAAAIAGISNPSLLAEPVAAARYFAEGQVEPGEYVAVYDLGGGTFDTAVLRRSSDGFELAGPPGGQEDLGGEAFDDRLFRYIGGHLEPEAWEQVQRSDDRRWRQARAAMRTQAREAKEALSRDQSYTVAIPLPIDVQFRITRGELEDLIRFDLKKTIAELADTIRSAGLAPGDVAAIYLVGGSSRVPIVTRLLSETFGRLPATWDDPKAVVSLGAAKATALVSGSQPAAVPMAAHEPDETGRAVDPAVAPLEPATIAATAEPDPDSPAIGVAAASNGPAMPSAPSPDGGTADSPLGISAAERSDRAATTRRRAVVVAPIIGLALVLVAALAAFGAAGMFGSSPGPSQVVTTPSTSSNVALASPTRSPSPSPSPSASPSPSSSPSPSPSPSPTPTAPPTKAPVAKPQTKTNPPTKAPVKPVVQPPSPTPTPPPPPPPNRAPVRAANCATVNVDAAGVYSTYDIWVQTSCFSDPDGDTFTIYANQPNYGSITGVSSCASGRTCWQYHSYGGWDGTPYWATFTFYARDPDGATSAAGTYNLCLNC